MGRFRQQPLRLVGAQTRGLSYRRARSSMETNPNGDRMTSRSETTKCFIGRTSAPRRGLVLLLALFLLFGASAQLSAQMPLYQVTGVTADDMLNVRDRPGVPGSTVIGRLAPDARDVERSGDVQDVGGRDWWHIRHPSLPVDGGWVNSRFLAAQGDVAETAPDGPRKPFTEAEGYAVIDHGAVR